MESLLGDQPRIYLSRTHNTSLFAPARYHGWGKESLLITLFSGLRLHSWLDLGGFMPSKPGGNNLMVAFR